MSCSDIHMDLNDPLTVCGRVHSIETFGTVDGPGTRLVVFTQGCPMRCAYCHNPDTWQFGIGTEKSVKEIVADSLGADVETLTEATSFKEDLGADSLDLFEMVMAFEEEFEKEIPSEDLEQLTTIGAVVAYLEK